MEKLKKETYYCREVAKILSIEVKHVKRLVKSGILEAIDIRVNPDPKRIDVRFIRISKSSLNDFFHNRVICKPTIKKEGKWGLIYKS